MSCKTCQMSVRMSHFAKYRNGGAENTGAENDGPNRFLILYCSTIIGDKDDYNKPNLRQYVHWVVTAYK